MLIDMEDAGYMFFDKISDFNNSQEVKETIESVVVSNSKKKRTITKDIINLLPHFVNATIESIELMTGIKAKKEKPNLKELSFDYKENIYIASSIGFYGDLDGVLILVFSENLTKKVSKILLGDDISLDDKELLNDVVGEFANIIVGNVKSNLSKQSTKIDLT